ncbi:Magnetosome protein MamX [uncultured Gammaproteobacteria bacterium]
MKAALSARHDWAAWIMALGIAFGMTMFLIAIFNDNPWNDHTYAVASPIVAGVPAPHRDGREKMVCSSCHVVVPAKTVAGTAAGVLPIVQGTPAPHHDGRENLVCSNCHTIVAKGKGGPGTTTAQPNAINHNNVASPPPRAVTVAMTFTPPPTPTLDPEAHELFTDYRFQGRVVRIAGTGSQSVWGDVFVLIDDGINPPWWMDLAPRLFLQSSGCPIGIGMFVKGTAVRDATQDASALVYGKSIMVNGELCPLRNSHLKGLWEEAGGGDVEEK